MNYAFILYDDILKNSWILELTKKVLGPSKACPITEIPKEITACNSVTLLFSSHSSVFSSLDFLRCLNGTFLKEQIVRIGVILIESAADSDGSLDDKLDGCFADRGVYTVRIPDGSNSLPITELNSKEELAVKLVQLKRDLTDNTDMKEELLQHKIDGMLLSHNTCTLSTGFHNRIRSTPIEYTYAEGCLYFLSEGGEKFANLFVNPYVSIAVYQDYSSFQNLEGLQIEGMSSMVEPFSEEYIEIVRKRGLSPEHLKSLPVCLNMFKVRPKRIQTLKSDFSKEGYKVKQVLDYDYY